MHFCLSIVCSRFCHFGCNASFNPFMGEWRQYNLHHVSSRHVWNWPNLEAKRFFASLGSKLVQCALGSRLPISHHAATSLYYWENHASADTKCGKQSVFRFGFGWMFARWNGFQFSSSDCSCKCCSFGHFDCLFNFLGSCIDTNFGKIASSKSSPGGWLAHVPNDITDCFSSSFVGDAFELKGTQIFSMGKPIYTFCLGSHCEFDLWRGRGTKCTLGHVIRIIVILVGAGFCVSICFACNGLCFGIFGAITFVWKTQGFFADNLH
mmetsp:Transcript_14921/g.19536  ORF Transcript_14921/g.19536 Transcript_14921/m.19536 type:complete len:265 (-) Transcript_14921:263-1057(-)